MPDALVGLKVGTYEPCYCGASGTEIVRCGTEYVLRCRHCSLLRQKLSAATVDFLKLTNREFGGPLEPIMIGRGKLVADGAVNISRSQDGRAGNPRYLKPYRRLIRAGGNR
jgi:hypothetical protein